MRFQEKWRATTGHTLALFSMLLTLPAIVAAQATITGRITDQSSQPVAEARVIVLGTSIYTATGQDGRYTVRNVPPGTAEIRVVRVGFKEQKKSVRTIAGETATLDFVMSQTVAQIQEVVVTATGEQRRVELGNAVTNLDAGKIVVNSPVANMGDLLVAKAPGVQVLPSNMTGGGSRVRIRGTASLSLSNDPVYIIDGIRMTSDQGSSFVGGTAPSRVNDLNPDDIENIEIVKGPSAATLYGTARRTASSSSRRRRVEPARPNGPPISNREWSRTRTSTPACTRFSANHLAPLRSASACSRSCRCRRARLGRRASWTARPASTSSTIRISRRFMTATAMNTVSSSAAARTPSGISPVAPLRTRSVRWRSRASRRRSSIPSRRRSSARGTVPKPSKNRPFAPI